MGVSVCLATYNGSNYIYDQLQSILIQLNKDDEIIIVDDCSTDNTVQIIKNFNDVRIKIFKNDVNKGYVYSFSRSMELAKNIFIFLSDQDDIWIKGRREIMVDKIIENNCLLLSSNFETFQVDTSKTKPSKSKLKNGDSKKYYKNIWNLFLGKRDYFGCTMLIRKEFLPKILPIPSFVECHDWWISIAANLLNSNFHMEETTVLRRIHNNNSSNIKRKLIVRLTGRFIFLRMLFLLKLRLIKLRLKKH